MTGGRPRADLARLEDAIGHKFSDRDLIVEALTHSMNQFVTHVV